MARRRDRRGGIRDGGGARRDSRGRCARRADSGESRVTRGVLEGRGAVVTGGGRGIGAELARSLAAAGAGVVVAARTGAEVEGVAAELRAGGAKAWSVRCDVTD